MSVNLGEFVVGEKPPPLVYQFQDANGVPINLTDGYQVRFTTRERWATTPAVENANGTVVTGATGIVEYVWTGPEFDGPGTYEAVLWVGNGSNRFATVQLNYTVRDTPGATPTI